MQVSITILSLLSVFPVAFATETGLPDCAVTCIERGIDVGEGLGCTSKTDLECLCSQPEVAVAIRDCAYAECTEEAYLDSLVEYVHHVCEEEMGLKITIATESPSATGEAATSSTGSSETAEATATDEAEPDSTEEADAVETTPETVSGAFAHGVPAILALAAAGGFAMILA